MQKFQSLNIEITQRLFSYQCGIMLEVNIKRLFENTPYSFKCNVTFTKIFGLTIEILNKVRRLRKQRVTAKKKAFK